MRNAGVDRGNNISPISGLTAVGQLNDQRLNRHKSNNYECGAGSRGTCNKRFHWPLPVARYPLPATRYPLPIASCKQILAKDQKIYNVGECQLSHVVAAAAAVVLGLVSH